MPFTFLNQNDKQATTLAANNLTWTATASGGVRAVDPQTTGKFYFEVAWSHATSADSGCGLAKLTATYSGLISNASNGVITYHGFGIFNNGTNTGVNPGAINSGSTVGIAVDLTGSLIWYTLDGTHWNSTSSTTNNPSTGVGGVSISGITGGNLYPVVINNAAVEAGTTNFGASAFTYSVPSGFTSGWPGVGPLANLPTPGPITTMQRIGPSYDDDQLSQEWSPLERVRNFRTKWLLNVGQLEVSKFVDYNVLTPRVAVNVSKFVEFVILNYLPVPQLPTGVNLLRRQASEWEEIDNQTIRRLKISTTTTPAISVTITGVAATGQVGTFTPWIEPGTLTGVQATGQVGVVSPAVNDTIGITGVQATGQVGNLIPEPEGSVSGVEADTAVGSLTPLVEPGTLSGVSAVTSVGTLDVAGGHAGLTGVQALAQIGNLLTNVSPNRTEGTIIGVQAQGQPGTLHQIEISAGGLVGVQAIGEVGTPRGLVSAGGLTMTSLNVTTSPGVAPQGQVSLRYSDTGGASWGDPIIQPLGATGRTRTVPQWRQLGIARNRVYEISWSTSQATALTGFMVELEESET